MMLTKSKFVLGIECPFHLWQSVHHPEKIRKATVAEELRFVDGQKVGVLAQSLFPDGISLPAENYSENLQKTKGALKKNTPLFEAGFEFGNCFSRADILVPAGKEWDIIEVKSGTAVKDINVHDVSFQKFVYEGCGLKIRKCFLLHLNKEYVRRGQVVVQELFVKDDITSEVDIVIGGIEARINEMFSMIASSKPPKAGILNRIVKDGHHDCIDENCIDVSEDSVFCLYYGKKLACEMFESGIVHIKDIPLHVKLSDRQKIQQSNKIYVDKKKIKQFLEKLVNPVYYLDFETFSTAVPMFDGLRPYSQVPFQFSLHVGKEHFEFLYDGAGDPREEFVLALKKVIGSEGTVLVYNAGFEVGRLKELSVCFPQHKKCIDNVIERIVDLLAPFRDFAYYNPKQKGSCSIKDVLPAITGKSYSGMDVADGGTASAEFIRITYGDKKNKEQTRKNLLKYCEYDTLAEKMIVEKMGDMAK